jgi:hypothetical protein
MSLPHTLVLATASVDRTVKVINTEGTVIWNSGHQHRDAINALKIFTDSKAQMVIVTGDDEGRVMVSTYGAVLPSP